VGGCRAGREPTRGAHSSLLLHASPVHEARGLGGLGRSCGAVLEASGPVPRMKQGSMKWKVMRETGKDPHCPENWIIGAINFSVPY